MFPYEIAPNGNKFLTKVLNPTLSVVWVPGDTVDCGEENEEEASIAVKIILAGKRVGAYKRDGVGYPFRRRLARI